jgi:protoporphyrinogen oxidase
MKRAVMIGAGPAGLTAAYQLSKAGVATVVLEKDTTVGGLSRTVRYKGYCFDIGGHRFYTKVKAVEDIWREVLSNRDFLRRQRLSRIYFNKKLFHYPLRLPSTLVNLGPWNAMMIVFSYCHSRLFPKKQEDTFEQWVSNRFGKRLYTLFFKTYTEKVWGIPCDEISAEWAAQRIKDLSLSAAVSDVFSRRFGRRKNVAIKTLIEEFDYPRRGPGMMWETMAELLQEQGGELRVGAGVEKINWTQGRVDTVEIENNGTKELVHGTHFISSMPIRELLQKFDPAPPASVLRAALNLKYRDFITVALIINQRYLFPDNWIYVHDPDVKLGRVQNFKNWSPNMVPDQDMTCLGLEYFCFDGDGLWSMSDAELIELGKRELEKIGLAKASDILDGTVLRVHKAYPIYDSSYKQSLEVVKGFFNGIENLQLVGRNGMHRYNNQDHSMLTAMLAVENILGANHDLWEVNADQNYHEEIKEGGSTAAGVYAELAATQPGVPSRRSQAEI